MATTTEAWARCRRHILAALETCSSHTINDIEAGIAAGAFQFWPGEDAAAVTEIANYPTGSYLNFWLLGGDLKELLTMRESIEAWARGQGCVRCGGTGRREWGRVLNSAGYRETSVEFEKDLL